jgi:xanthine dehydrogenase iron-sulfur cluster and FAD-binding subunit A
MIGSLSKNRLVRNEQLVRLKNINIKDGIKKYFRNDKSVTTTPVAFECECSEPDCGKHVKVSIDTYEKTHQRNDRFTVSKGHDTASVEKVVAKKSNYEIVEKNELEP